MYKGGSKSAATAAVVIAAANDVFYTAPIFYKYDHLQFFRFIHSAFLRKHIVRIVVHTRPS